MIEEVKKILDQILIKYPVSDYPFRENINWRYTKEICQLTASITLKEVEEYVKEKFWHQGSNNIWYIYLSPTECEEFLEALKRGEMPK